MWIDFFRKELSRNCKTLLKCCAPHVVDRLKSAIAANSWFKCVCYIRQCPVNMTPFHSKIYTSKFSICCGSDRLPTVIADTVFCLRSREFRLRSREFAKHASQECLKHAYSAITARPSTANRGSDLHIFERIRHHIKRTLHNMTIGVSLSLRLLV